METNTAPTAPELTVTPTVRDLVVSTAVAPVLWLAHLIVSFALVGFVCDRNAGWLLHVLSAVALGLAAAATAVGWRLLRDRSRTAQHAGGTAVFVAAVGAANSALFTAIIALSWIAGFAIPPCFQ
jgi:hypothetical protein